jgi:hypothetical protein
MELKKEIKQEIIDNPIKYETNPNIKLEIKKEIKEDLAQCSKTVVTCQQKLKEAYH